MDAIVSIVAKYGNARERALSNLWLELQSKIITTHNLVMGVRGEISRSHDIYFNSMIAHFDDETSHFIRTHRHKIIEKYSHSVLPEEYTNAYDHEILDKVKLLVDQHRKMLMTIGSHRTQQKNIESDLATITRVTLVQDGRMCYRFDKTRAENTRLFWRTFTFVIAGVMCLLGYISGAVAIMVAWSIMDFIFSWYGMSDSCIQYPARFFGYRPMLVFTHPPEKIEPIDLMAIYINMV